MLSEMGVRSMIGGGDEGFGSEELGRLLREQRRQEASDLERELNIYRSGSAPPTVEGSLNAVGVFCGKFLSDEELLSDPAYHSYYYTHVNLNPRLPPPLLSKEDWRSKQRLQAGSSTLGGIDDRRKVDRVEVVGGGAGSGSLFSMQPGFDLQDRNAASSTEVMSRGGDGVIGKSLRRRKSFAEILQDDNSHRNSISSYPSRPASRNAFDDVLEPLGSSGTGIGLQNDAASLDSLQHSGTIKGIVSHQSMASCNFPSVIGSSISRSSTPERHLVARDQNTCIPPVGMNLGATYNNINCGLYFFNDKSTNIAESEDLLPALSRMCLSSSGPCNAAHIPQAKLQQDICEEQNMFSLQGGQKHVKEYPLLKKDNSEHLSMPSMRQSLESSYHESLNIAGSSGLSSSALRLDEQNPELHWPIAQSSNSYLKTQNVLSALSVGSPCGSPAHYQNVDCASAAFMSYGLSGSQINPALYSLLPNHINNNNLPPLFEYAATASALASLGVDSSTLGGGFSSGLSLNRIADLPNLNRPGNSTSTGASAHLLLLDPLYFEYLKAAGYASQAASNFSGPPVERGHSGNSYFNLLGIQKAYLEALFQQQKQYDGSFLGSPKIVADNHVLYEYPSFGLNLQYPGSPLSSPILPASPGGPGTPFRLGEHSMNFPYGMRNFVRGAMCTWQSNHTSSTDENSSSSLLEVFKSSKLRCFELSEIAGHVVEFSSDQYGSRFIQQKLETATAEEKNMVFKEIMIRALSLMTDVFGNYVVQKFFEHGTEAQIRELANHLKGHVLALSLQMYGCRVIQKAIEVVSLDQQTEMVKELDGHVMHCVRDQNGNHVIQKCIECVPQNAIQCIILSFYDQVVTLSTHPYGCRVIQRVLEHCHDPQTQRFVMDEIMHCVCMLAQDQYGNYVIQHLLEHGKPDERSAVISKLAGLSVPMSQQKFSSNVIEKCLTFGSAEERQMLINEMIGSTEENDPLQAMMKDQFANYVVQKVLETCDDQQRELILTRIKVHLTALKKYTYGKHIVARVEKLVAAGERRIGLQFPYP